MNNEFLNSTIKQYRYYKSLADKAIDQLDNEQLFYTPDPNSNSIAIIIKHISGNIVSRWTDFLTSDGEKTWRNRDSEFELEKMNTENLLANWNEAWKLLFDTLTNLKGEDLNKLVYIRNKGHYVHEAINRQLAHYAYHIGQIVFLAKMICRESWNTLSIPKGKSDDYNVQEFSKPKKKGHFTDSFLKE